MSRSRNTRKSGNRRIADVRVVDSAVGSDGPLVDRMISAVKISESQIRVVVGDLTDVFTTTTAGVNGTIGFDNILQSDEVASLVQQYNLFRVRAIKFDIYDINPGQSVLNTFGIWHDNYEGAAPTYTRANVADLPDSRSISSGTGQTTLYWVAHGVAEMQFQQASSVGTPYQAYGGLKYFLGAVSQAVPKYTIQMHAVVDFRGRR